VTGAQLLAIARHECEPGTTDYVLALRLTYALTMLVENLTPQQRGRLYVVLRSVLKHNYSRRRPDAMTHGAHQE
jgi:hypothetical protein